MTSATLDGSTDLHGTSIGDLLSRLGSDSSLLVRQEIQLAQAELKEKAAATAAGVVLLVVAGIAALAGLGAGVTAAIAGFAQLLPVWAAALVVLGGFFLIGGLLALIGLRRLKAAAPPIPQRAVRTAKETPGELVS